MVVAKGAQSNRLLKAICKHHGCGRQSHVVGARSIRGAAATTGVVGKQGAAKVLLRRAAPGTGVIAGGPLRSIFGRLGIEDIVAKSLGSSNSNTMIAATFDALQRLSSPKNIAHRRGKNVTELSVNSNSESK